MGGTILLVDDDPDVLEVLSDELRMGGYDVLTAESGNRALDVLEHAEVDLVLSDLRMPDGDGRFLLQQLRQRDARRPPVAIVTGYGDLSEQELTRLGGQALLTKPYRAEELLDTVAALIGAAAPH